MKNEEKNKQYDNNLQGEQRKSIEYEGVWRLCTLTDPSVP
jgi:hypothetical protein